MVVNLLVPALVDEAKHLVAGSSLIVLWPYLPHEHPEGPCLALCTMLGSLVAKFQWWEEVPPELKPGWVFLPLEETDCRSPQVLAKEHRDLFEKSFGLEPELQVYRGVNESSILVFIQGLVGG